MKNFILITVVFLGMLTLWELSTTFFMEHRFILPAPSQVLKRLIQNPTRFWFHSKITFTEMLAGMSLAFFLAFPLGWLMDRFRSANLLLQPLCIMIQCIPMFTLAPLMILWFGWSLTAIVVSTTLMIFFPLVMNIYRGLSTVPEYLKDYFRIHEATPWQMFIKLQLPWVKPYVFSGLRISTAIAGTGAIAGEWAGAQAGLGLLMQESRRATDLETTFGALFCLALLSGVFYAGILFLERVWGDKNRTQAKTVLLLVMCLIATGCQSPPDSPSKIKVLLDWVPNPNHVPLYAGLSKKYFQEQGIDLEVLTLQDPSDSIPYVISQKADLALYYMPQMVRANAKGAGLEPVAILIDQPLNCFLYRRSHPLNTLKDLEGKKIGYCIDGTETTELDKILSLNQVDLAQVEKRNVSFDFVSALGTGQVDAVFGAFWNIEGAHLRSLGIATGYIALPSVGYPSYAELLFMTSAASPCQDPQFKERFQKALSQSIRFCQEFPEEAFDLYRVQQLDKSPATLAWEKEAWLMTIPALAQQTKPEN